MMETEFSAGMGGMHNISLMGGTDKTVTFSTGPTSLSGWGSSSMSILNTTPASSFLQSPGTGLLNSPQPVDNQNFQLGKPPPGNKRGKR
ncbi:hypothetical protein J6590_085335 [Homalodisca vitripennis]|nr:hypothetical protein J6590_085335 [Homalodisca vitripennis]